MPLRWWYICNEYILGVRFFFFSFCRTEYIVSSLKLCRECIHPMIFYDITWYSMYTRLNTPLRRCNKESNTVNTLPNFDFIYFTNNCFWWLFPLLRFVPNIFTFFFLKFLRFVIFVWRMEIFLLWSAMAYRKSVSFFVVCSLFVFWFIASSTDLFFVERGAKINKFNPIKLTHILKLIWGLSVEHFLFTALSYTTVFFEKCACVTLFRCSRAVRVLPYICS